MNDKIKEVHDYFKSKIVNGDYEVKDNAYYTMKVVIDFEYDFTLWMANDGINFGMYAGDYNFMTCAFSDEEKDLGYQKAKAFHDEYKLNELLAQKRKELEELENELKQ